MGEQEQAQVSDQEVRVEKIIAAMLDSAKALVKGEEYQGIDVVSASMTLTLRLVRFTHECGIDMQPLVVAAAHIMREAQKGLDAQAREKPLADMPPVNTRVF